jgi:hypothetical protein
MTARLADRLACPIVRESEIIRNRAIEKGSVLTEHEEFIAKAEACDQIGSMSDTVSSSWVVVDYCLSFEVNRTISLTLRRLRESQNEDLPKEALKARSDQVYSTIRHIQGLANRTSPPTLAVLFKGTDRQRRPGCASFPLFQSEATDPEAVADEIIATCRGIEAV